jgi:hypothetical protein
MEAQSAAQSLLKGSSHLESSKKWPLFETLTFDKIIFELTLLEISKLSNELGLRIRVFWATIAF